MAKLKFAPILLVLSALSSCYNTSETIATIPTDSDDPDTESSDSGGDVGVTVGSAKWYLGAVGASCADTCAIHGGYDEATATFAGDSDSGGSTENCLEVLIALEVPGEQFVSSTTGDGLPGVGCYFNTGYNPDAQEDTDTGNEADYYSFKRIPLIPTTAQAVIDLGSRACACLE